jgi:hypothetical protein
MALMFIEYHTKEGIQQHLTTPYTMEHNGVIERRNQTIMGMARSMLKAMAVPSHGDDRLHPAPVSHAEHRQVHTI